MTAPGTIVTPARAPRSVVVSDREARGADRATAAVRSHTQAVSLPRETWLDLVRERMANGASLWIRVRGASMAPAIAPGTVVRLSPLAKDGELRRGDVVLAVLPTGLPVVHRIVSMDDDGIWLRGDALGGRDPRARHDAVLARVTAVRVGAEDVAVPAAPRWPRLRWWRAVLARWWRARFTRTITHS